MSNYIISLNSLRLSVDTPFLPFSPPSNNQSEKIFTKVTAIVKDVYGKSVSGIKVFISDDSVGNLKKVKIFDSDQTKEINVVQQGGIEGFFVETDRSGNILFFIYPFKAESVRIKLFSQVIGSTDPVIAKDIIYIANNIPENMEADFIQPEIFDYSYGDLKSPGKKDFMVKIVPYNNVANGDSILFFVNNQYTRHSIQIHDESDLGSYSIPLPYAIFLENKLSRFFYVVIRASGDMVASKSQALDILYKGNEYNEPWTDVNRIYESCKVYSSYGVYPGSIVEEYTYIYDDIISANNKEGLYVQITGTNDQNDTEHVTFGSEVTLNLYINSRQGHVTEHYTKRIPSVPDESGGNTATLTFNIPYDILKYNESYPDKPGEIYFDYQVGSDNDDVTYGKIWQAKIDTDMK
ncbi:hypothetical protein KKJ09_16690 [Xenorhabdus bovienii]|uniref:hypothetical protein n=1 Tax=Xenorhabdus bovienii TaxID=40576 RepID=UPI0023B22610|nr:hypothetical protein [Xenorhabdus bovienii]MDE9495178.1 hypothetical protein [Xenorhabdus bovienii]MDE9503571.1 hypothetical protein [Xenorhabdus bovienii]MDE9527294.1 hypothetical protein [Xenorhabdus bovienii]MDE9570443.1 hypothetical protein [Xenorhabdus bovienii]